MRNGSNIEESAHQQQLASDWPERFKLSIWLVKDEGHWSALAAEFDVVGMGDSQEDALDNLHQNLASYLESFKAEGAPFKLAKRGIPRRERLRLWYFAILTSVKTRFTPRDRRRPGDGRSRAVEHSREDLAVPVHC